MLNSHAVTRYAYHFLSEALILFMVLLPFLHHRHMWVPYWSYLTILLITCVLFSLMTMYITNYVVYMAIAPIMAGVFYFLDYPLFYSVLFSVFFVWRYIMIRKEDIISRESSYILITLMLMVVIGVVVPDIKAMLLPFLVILINVIGFLWSHLGALSKKERKQVDKKLIPVFIAILIAGAIFIYFTYDIIRWAISGLFFGIISFLGGSASWFSNLLQFIQVPEHEWPEQQNDMQTGDGFWNELEDTSTIEQITPYLVVAAGITLVIFIIILFVVYWKRRFHKPAEEQEANPNITYSEIGNNEGMEFGKTRRFNRWLNKPKHPVRKLVYQFEREAKKNNKGRKHYETLEEWLNRIEINADLEVYQMVRYGEIEQVNEDDVIKLRNAIKQVDLRLDHSQ
ncbi:hypothetical protein [Oceanobacillus kapialis]|uniref:DUF4129 domain-containing protein n=1 Tax=Oceanobacillus kapialis TaxID=481353 RepID=A0ABW5Q0E0_9BACI